jgi:hypothetical protein
MSKINANLTIPDDLYRQIRAASAMRGISVSAIILEAIATHPDIASFAGIQSVKKRGKRNEH